MIRIDTVRNCLIIVKEAPIDYFSIRLIDSLVNLKSDTSIVKVSMRFVEHSPLKTDYVILYKNDNIWRLTENKSLPFVVNLPFNIKNINKTNVTMDCPMIMAYSPFDFFYYLIVINKKIVKSYNSNVPVAMAIEIDKKLTDELALFALFDRYLTSIKSIPK